MKKIFLLCSFLLFATLAHAQPVDSLVIGIGHGGTGAKTAARALKNLLPDTTGKSGKALEVVAGGGISWTTLSSGSSFPPFPNDNTLFLRGDSTWSAVAGGSAYFKDDGGTPVLAPAVTASTKGIAIMDSASNTAFGGIAFGNKALNSGLFGISIGSASVVGGRVSNTASYGISIGDNCQNSGTWGLALGGASVCKSIRSIVIGGGFDASTSQVDDGQHGANILIGSSSATNAATDALNVCLGYNANCRGVGNTCIGSQVYANGSGSSYNTYIGYDAANGNVTTGKYQVILGSNGSLAGGASNYPTLGFDTTTAIGACSPVTARNTFEILFGRKNTTTTGLLAVFADGGADGNAATFDCLQIAKNGTVTAGKNFVAGTSLGGSTTPTAGTVAKDNVIVAWGNIAADGTITSQYGNFTMSHTGASGVYTITLPNSLSAGAVDATPQTAAFFSATLSGATVTISTTLGTLAIPVATDVAFYFIVTGRP